MQFKRYLFLISFILDNQNQNQIPPIRKSDPNSETHERNYRSIWSIKDNLIIWFQNDLKHERIFETFVSKAIKKTFLFNNSPRFLLYIISLVQNFRCTRGNNKSCTICIKSRLQKSWKNLAGKWTKNSIRKSEFKISLKTKTFPKDNNRLISKGNVNNYEMENLNCRLGHILLKLSRKAVPQTQ